MNHEISYEKKYCTDEIPTSKTFGPTKYPEKKLNQQNNHEKKFQINKTPMKVRWRDDTTPAKPTMACDIRNLADSIQNKEQN